MKPFDIELAKQGKPVCTRDGRKARIICFDRYNRQLRCIVALVTESTGLEELYAYTLEGKISSNEKSDHDLVMVSEKKTGWINIYPCPYKEKAARLGPYVHKTQEKARDIDETLHLFTSKPFRNVDHWISTANDVDIFLPKNLYPDVTWINGPRELILK